MIARHPQELLTAFQTEGANRKGGGQSLNLTLLMPGISALSLTALGPPVLAVTAKEASVMPRISVTGRQRGTASRTPSLSAS